MGKYKKEAPRFTAETEEESTVQDYLGIIISLARFYDNSESKFIYDDMKNIIDYARRAWDLVPEEKK